MDINKLKELAETGMTRIEIANEMGYCKRFVSFTARKNGIKIKRQPGSGKVNKKDRKKGQYKIYALQDPRTQEYFYVGITKQWLCKRLEYHIYGATKLNQRSKKDCRILDILKENKKPKIVLLERLKTQNKNEALELENKYIYMYGKDNKMINKFKGKYKPIGGHKYKEKIIKMLNENKSTDEIVKETGCHIHTVQGWKRYLKMNKGMKIKKDIEKIRLMLANKKTVKQIADEMNTNINNVYYRLKKIKRYEKKREAK